MSPSLALPRYLWFLQSFNGCMAGITPSGILLPPGLEVSSLSRIVLSCPYLSVITSLAKRWRIP